MISNPNLLELPLIDRHIITSKIGFALFKTVLATSWTIPSEVGRFVDGYYINIWEGRYLREVVREGVISKYGRSYHVTWLNLPAECRKAKKVAASFRHSNLTGHAYVLIRIAGDNYVKHFQKGFTNDND